MHDLRHRQSPSKCPPSHLTHKTADGSNTSTKHLSWSGPSRLPGTVTEPPSFLATLVSCESENPSWQQATGFTDIHQHAAKHEQPKSERRQNVCTRAGLAESPELSLYWSSVPTLVQAANLLLSNSVILGA